MTNRNGHCAQKNWTFLKYPVGADFENRSLHRREVSAASIMSTHVFRASTGESGLRVLPDLFKNRVLQLAEETVDSLSVIWQEAGYEEAECQSLLGDLLNKLKQTCANELASEQQILEHAKQQVSSKLEEYSDYCAQLGRDPPADDVPQGANYTDKLAELERLLNGISGEVNERQQLLNVEMEAINDLVSTLGESEPSSTEFDGPQGTPHLSDVRLNLMRTFKAKLQVVKQARLEEMMGVAKLCVASIADLVLVEEGFETMNEGDKYDSVNKALVQFMEDGEKKLTMQMSQADLELLNSRNESLAQEKERRRNELATSGAEIARLWTLLRIPNEEREEFQNSFKMNLSMETLEKGRKELDRLHQVRAESLGRVVTSIRADILSLWEESGIESEDARKEEFAEYYVPMESLQDSTVDTHEAYYSCLLARVEELRPLLNEVVRRENIAQERIELEHLQMNPERLSARGKNAREERKREEGMHTRVKNLEKITKRLLSMISTWEETNGPFYYAGERYADRVTQQDVNYIAIRDQLRNSRKRKDNKSEPAAPKAVKRPTAASSGYGQKAMSGSLNKTATLNKENAERESTDTNATEVRARASSVTQVREL